MSTFEWLDRGFIYGPHYTLCLNEKEFHAALDHLGVVNKPSFLNRYASATTHFPENQKGKLCAVVCLGDWKEHNGVEIAGLLTHEAVHIFQEWCLRHGEVAPGQEIEAWSIQWLAQNLMWEFARRTVKVKQRAGSRQ